MEKQTYSVNEVADLLNVSRGTVRRWITQKKIESFKIAHTRRIPKEHIQKLMGESA